MRFFHRKRQCYVVGEGSFAGQFSSFPDLNEESDELDSSLTCIMMSILRRNTASRGILNRFEVPVEVEPDSGGKSNPMLSLSFSPPGESPQALIPSSPIMAKVPSPVIPDDFVILKDGRIIFVELFGSQPHYSIYIIRNAAVANNRKFLLKLL